MAEYDPPIYDVPVFNPAFFINEDEITKGYLRANFLEFPIGQGLETLPDLRVENDKINLGLSTVAGTDSVAIGHSATASDTEAVAIGHNSNANGDEAIAIGHNSSVLEDGVVVGHNSTGEINSVVFGHNNTCGENSICLGHSSTADGEDSIALGRSATTSTNNSAISIGKFSSSSSFSSALGWSSSAGGGGSTAVGVSANSSGLRATAIGRSTVASGTSSVAMCDGANATGDYSTAVGFASTASANNAIAVGRVSIASGVSSTAVGLSANASGQNSVALGWASVANGNNSICIGNGNTNNVAGRCVIKVSDDNLILDGYGDGSLSVISDRVISSSDRRLKRDITYYDEPSIEKIMKLKPAYYYWKWDNGRDEDLQLGFIAQDVEDIIPWAVDGKKYEYKWLRDIERNPILDASGNLQFTDEPRYRGFSDRPVIAVLVKAVQEQQEQINQLKERISFLNI